jgi:hypothetical protein
MTRSGDDTQGKKYLDGLRRTTSLPCPLSICHSAYIGKSKEVGVKLSDMMPFCSVEAFTFVAQLRPMLRDSSVSPHSVAPKTAQHFY